MHRKGFQVPFAFVMMGILLLIVAFGVLLLVKTAFDRENENVPAEQCRITVLREAVVNSGATKAKGGYTARDFASNIDCEQISVSIVGKEPSKLAAMTADYVDQCWKMFGSGNYALFSKQADPSTFCHVCYTVTYDAGASVDTRAALARKPTITTDIPESFGGQQAIIYINTLSSIGNAQKIAIRPLDKIQEVCPNAAFAAQRVT
jgi:hypothetical protein